MPPGAAPRPRERPPVGDQAGELRHSLGQGPGLVEGEGVARRQALERRSSLDQDAVPRQPGHAGEHRRRSRQDQPARAGDHQHGDRPRPDVGPAREIADEAASRRPTSSTTGRKYRARRSATFLQPCLATPRLGNQAEDLAERRQLADLLGVDLDHAELVDGAGEDRVAGPLVDRQ